MKRTDFIPLPDYRELAEDEMVLRAADFVAELRTRRTVRHFSDRPVPEEVLRDCVAAAASAPSGANRQPWHFVIISDPKIKKKIREAAEEEERDFYHGRAPDDWLEALAPLGTDEHKPFLETAPYVIAVFAERYGIDEEGNKLKNYYVSESVGIAVGFLITAIHHAGLVSLTHTPAPMRFLAEILGRPGNERPFLILPVGYPSEEATVPNIDKKPLEQIATFLRKR